MKGTLASGLVTLGYGYGTLLSGKLGLGGTALGMVPFLYIFLSYALFVR
jgi:hypothetical protein